MASNAIAVAAPPESAATNRASSAQDAEIHRDPVELALLLDEILRRLDEMGGFLESAGLGGREVGELNSELRRLRGGEIERHLDPVLIGLIRLYDSIACRAAAFRQAPRSLLCAEQILEHLEGVAAELARLLAEYGVAPFHDPGDRFEPNLQRTLRLEPTQDPALVGRVAIRVRPGFRRGEKIIRKERVVVFSN